MSQDLAEALLRYTDAQTGAAPYATAIDGLFVLRSDHPKPPMRRLARPALCIVAQGAKWATFGEDRLYYRAGEALVVGVETPSVGRVVEASPEKPCLVLLVELDPGLMRTVAEGLDAVPPPTDEAGGGGIFVTDFSGPLADCALRLVRLLETPAAIAALSPLVMREICYWLLTGPRGGDIARLALSGSPPQRVMAAMHALRDRFAETVRIEELAAIAQLSASAFHRQFKALTSLTPLQYQKQLRLLEARRLMTTCGAGAETAAYQVGYESASQFSREYARLFGAPPKRDVARLQADLHLVDEDTITRRAA